MQQVLIVIHLMVVVALVIVVLLQRSEGGALGMGGGGGFMSGRSQANALTRATAILATLFFITSLSLTIMAGWTRTNKSIFDAASPAGAPARVAPAPPSGTVLDQLNVPVGPVTPAAPAVPEPPKSQ